MIHKCFQRILFTSLTACLLSAAGLAAPALSLASSDALWSDVPEPPARARQLRRVVPASYRTVALDTSGWQLTMNAIPRERSGNSGSIIQLPMPDGSQQRFSIFEAPVMEDELAAKFPEIRTFAGQGIDDPHASVRLDWTSAGFHAQILSPSGAVYIDPYATGQVSTYVSYLKRNYQRAGGNDIELLAPEDPGGRRAAANRALRTPVAASASSGATLRTYRIAIAADGEYSTFHGGTVPAVAAELVTLVNRVTGIYEVEIASRLVLVANNDLLIYLDPNTDPYSNDNASALLSENQANIDTVIGSSNYDIGHVVTTGGGGLASLGVVCNNSFKARGETGLPNPVGDPFYVDYVAHEIGHQFAGNHTWNGNGGSCSAGNRSGSTAYEPGSGSTIQAYAGICGEANNLQSNSDPYFHTLSFDEMVAHTTLGSGAGCAVETATGNGAPVPDAGSGGFAIPSGTPFVLTGTATDPNGDPMTYSWEQFDLGPQGVPSSPNGDAPLFRSFSPTTSLTRVFPRMSDILNETSTIGELLPDYGRNLTFRLTARDNRAGGGGVGYDEVAFTVDGGSGPFAIIQPTGNTAWSSNETATVVWDVADTDLPPVSCSEVNITFSTDGGATFPTTLAAATPNDGSEVVAVPNLTTSAARLRIECCPDPEPAPSACFFSVSEGGDFSVLIPVPAVCAASPAPGCLEAESASLKYSEKAAGKEKMKIQWKKISTTTVIEDFGNPVSGLTQIAACIYDDSDTLVEDFIIARAGDTCSGKPCWKAKSTKGYSFKDKEASTKGISKISLSSGDAGRGKADISGKNNAAKGQTLLPTGVAAALNLNIAPTIQIIAGDGECVEATLTRVTKDDGVQYQAKK